jgi:hypothetical protein
MPRKPFDIARQRSDAEKKIVLRKRAGTVVKKMRELLDSTGIAGVLAWSTGAKWQVSEGTRIEDVEALLDAMKRGEVEYVKAPLCKKMNSQTSPRQADPDSTETTTAVLPSILLAPDRLGQLSSSSVAFAEQASAASAASAAASATLHAATLHAATLHALLRKQVDLNAQELLPQPSSRAAPLQIVSATEMHNEVINRLKKSKDSAPLV